MKHGCDRIRHHNQDMQRENEKILYINEQMVKKIKSNGEENQKFLACLSKTEVKSSELEIWSLQIYSFQRNSSS
jgi:hypothetical protein